MLIIVVILGIFLPAEFLYFPSRFLVVYFSVCFSFLASKLEVSFSYLVIDCLLMIKNGASMSCLETLST